MSEKITACFLCACHCGLVMTLDDDGKITKVSGDRDNPRTKGFICVKGANQAAHIDSPHRLSQPRKREGERLVEVSWEEAIEGVAAGLLGVKKKHGPRAVGMAMGGSPHPAIQNMIGYMLLRALGSRNMYSPISLEFAGRYYANKKMFGCSFLEGYPDFHHANFALIIGTNPVTSHPLMLKSLKEISKDPDRALIVVDPRLSETAKLADRHTYIKPSTDVYLLLAILNVYLAEKLYDPDFAQRTTGLDAVAKTVERLTPELAAEITGVDADLIREIARKFASQKPAVIHYDMGVIANHHGALVSWAIKTLMLLNGGMGTKGGLLYNPTIANSNQTENFAFGGKTYTSRVSDFEERTGHMPITTLQEEILTPGAGQIRAMIVGGCNPLRTYANSAKMERAFADLECLVSIEPFLTEVGRLAHYVLPVCSFYEQDNVSFQFEHMFPTRFVQLTQKIREPQGESRPEWMIYRDLARAMGVNFMDNPIPDLGFKAADAIASMRGNKAGVNRQEAMLKMLARAGGTSWSELKAKPHGFDLGPSKDMLAQIRLPGKKACLDVPEFMSAIDGLPASAPAADPEYPLILSTTCRNHGNVNTLYQNEKWLAKRLPVNALIMHPDDAYARDLSEESKVRIRSAAGETIAALALSDEVMPGTIYLRGGLGILSRDPNDHSGELRGGAASMLIPDQETEAITGMPLLSGAPCRVEKTS